MKTVLVAGFFDPVKKALELSHREHLAGGSIVWVRQVGENREVNLGELSQQCFAQISRGAKSILVILAVLKGREWVESKVEGLIASARASNPDVECEVVHFHNAVDREGVLAAIGKFGVTAPAEFSSEGIRARAPNGKIFCVSMEGRTSILDSLKRVGFPDSVIHECFEEEQIPRAKNSNLMEYLISRAKQYRYLLYAWAGLRTIKPEVKGKFEKCYEAETGAKVAELVRRWIRRGV